MSERLPISVVLPCRNALPALPAHLRTLGEWLPNTEQVIVVDSSSDGSLEYLRGELAGHPRVEFHTVPPGLYAAWNFGVARAEAEFVYFATIGDAADRGGITRLLAAAREEAADIVISPPRIVDESGAPRPDHRWPLHRFLETFAGPFPYGPGPVERFLLTVSFLPETLIGSSASNLYRRAALGSEPFPTDIGRFGDSAWMVRAGAGRRWAVLAEPCAPFVVHESAHPGDSAEFEMAATRRLLAMARETAARLAGEEGNPFWPAWIALVEAHQEKRVLSNQTKALDRKRLNEEKDAALEEKAVVLEKKVAELAKRGAAIEAKNAWIERSRRELAALREKLEDRDRRIAELEGPYRLNARLLDALARRDRGKK